MNDRDTLGHRVRALFENATRRVAIIAPFIKVGALRSLIRGVPDNIPVRCVSRWIPREIAAGVSDPEIFDVLDERGNSSLSLVDRLHAKLYIADERCLAGSANVTFAGLGEGDDGGNVEILVESTVDDLEVAKTLDMIAESERQVTRRMAVAARLLADNLGDQSVLPVVGPDVRWFPKSRRPEHAFRCYSRPPEGFVGAADRILLDDVASANLPIGLTEWRFEDKIRLLLNAIPVAEELLAAEDDTTLTRADAARWLHAVAGGDFSSNDLWIAFVDWMSHFFFG